MAKIDSNKSILISEKPYNLSLEWILGFFEGDGSFNIQLKPTAHHKTGYSVILIFEIHQNAIDVDLLRAIQCYLGVGKVEIGRKVKKENPQT
jgi:LAGLIDADG endonuclease